MKPLVIKTFYHAPVSVLIFLAKKNLILVPEVCNYKTYLVHESLIFNKQTNKHKTQRFLEKRQSQVEILLTSSALANTMGSPNAETTMPVVRNIASSLQALLVASVSSTNLLAMQYGIGERM